MNHYGEQALRHWRQYLPGSYGRLEDPEGFFTGLGGGFYGLYFRYVDPDAVFPIALSVEMVFIAVVGGLATVVGPVIGAIFLTTIGELFRERFLVGHLIFYGLFMMLVIRYLPEGIWGGARRAWARRPGG